MNSNTLAGAELAMRDSAFPIRRLDWRNQSEREAFFAFVAEIWPGLDFATWYAQQMLEPGYQPHVIFDAGRIVANVSATPMRLLAGGECLDSVQLGTVATLPAYRSRGLSRRLLEYVLMACSERAELVFLFANDSVGDFYPRFGFRRVLEHDFHLDAPGIEPAFTGKRLDATSAADLALIHDLLKRRLPVSPGCAVLGCERISLWHLMEVYPDCLIHFPEEDALVVLREEEDCAHLFDLVLTRPADTRSVLAKALQRKPQRLAFGFTPDALGLAGVCSTVQDSLLFVRGRLPIEHGVFQFPVTIHT